MPDDITGIVIAGSQNVGNVRLTLLEVTTLLVICRQKRGYLRLLNCVFASWVFRRCGTKRENVTFKADFKLCDIICFFQISKYLFIRWERALWCRSA